MTSKSWSALACWIIATSASAASPDSRSDEARNFVLKHFDSDTRFGQTLGALDKIYVGEAFRRGRQALYVVYDESSCGSGGCNLRVVVARPRGLKSVGGAPAVWPAFLAMRGREKAWPDIIVCRAGGGSKAHQTKLVFNGRRYRLDGSETSPRTGPTRKITFAPSLPDQCLF